MIFKFFKQAFKYGLPFGLFMGFYFTVGVGNDVSVGVKQGVIAGLIVGGLWAIHNVWFYIVRHRKWGVPYAVLGNGVVNYSDKLVLTICLNDAFALCLESLKTLNRKYILDESDKSSGKIEATLKMTFSRSTEYIIFEIVEIDSSRSLVNFSSCTASSNATEDYGSNWYNINQIKNHISSTLRIDINHKPI